MPSGLSESIELARTARHVAARAAIVVAIEAERFTLGAGLSAAVWPRPMTVVERLLAEFAKPAGVSGHA